MIVAATAVRALHVDQTWNETGVTSPAFTVTTVDSRNGLAFFVP